MVWHAERRLSDADLVLLPGGFAHGDYLRAGALARFSPIMDAVRDHARRGGLVLGICNGFQILCEAGLLPGAFQKNASLRFVCKWVQVRVDNSATPFSSLSERGAVLRMPVNHFQGSWYCSGEELRRLKAAGQIVLRYVDNPNGSLDDVAGVMSSDATVFGLMPHPERACEALLGSEDGASIFGSALQHSRPTTAVGGGWRATP